MNVKRLEKVKVEFGKRVRMLRLEQDMSQFDLSAKAGIDVTQVKRIELAKVNTSLTTIYSIAKALEVPVGRLFEF
jgi:transcriptional regulator with XRE-family HTH domain